MSSESTLQDSWSQRIFGGFRKTSERLSENLSGIVGTTRLDDGQLDDIEDALILSDLGPRAAARIRERLAEERFERDADHRAIMEVVAREIAEILNLSVKTIESHREHIKNKLTLESSAQMVQRATQWVEAASRAG